MTSTLLESLVSESEHAPLTKSRYLGNIREFLRFAGAMPVAWTPDAARRWKEHLRRQVELTPQTINVKLNSLRYASHRYSKLNHNNPAYDFAAILELLPPGPKKRKHALSFEDAAKLIEACRGPRPIDVRDFAMSTVGFRTGMRRFSMCGIRFEDLVGRKLTITLKGRRRHTLPALDDVEMAALAPWLGWLRARGVKTGFIFRALARQRVDGSIPVAAKLSPHGLYKALIKRAENADVRFTPHVFRHTFVTWMQDLGLPGYLIQAYTGHKSDAMVLEYTDAWLRAEREPPTNRFPDWIGGAPPRG